MLFVSLWNLQESLILHTDQTLRVLPPCATSAILPCLYPGLKCGRLENVTEMYRWTRGTDRINNGNEPMLRDSRHALSHALSLSPRRSGDIYTSSRALELQHSCPLSNHFFHFLFFSSQFKKIKSAPGGKGISSMSCLVTVIDPCLRYYRYTTSIFPSSDSYLTLGICT